MTMRGIVSSIFNLFVVLASMFLLAAATHSIASRQLAELEGILVLTGFLLAALVFSHRFLFADFEPLSITRTRR